MISLSLRLTEWQSLVPTPGGPTEGVNLGDDPVVANQARRLTEAGILEILELRRGLSVRLTSFVGPVRLGAIEITAVPKLPTDSLLRLMRYAYGLRDLRLFPMTAVPTQSTGLQDLLVWQLIEEVRELLGRGLRRTYARRAEPLASPRDRIDFQALAAEGPRTATSLPCVHYRRDDNNLINQILLAGLRLAAVLDVDRSLRLQAGRLADLLAETVSPVRQDHLAFRRLEGSMDRTTRAYEPAFHLTRILAESEGLSLRADTGPRLPGFFFDMNCFFQALVEKFLSDNLTDHQVIAELRLRGFLAYHPTGIREDSRPQFPVPTSL